MATLKNFIYWLSAISAIAGLYSFVITHLQQMDWQYFKENTLPLISIIGMTISLLGLIVISIKESKRLDRIENEMYRQDETNMKNEMLLAVGWWIQAFNHSQDERDAYIAKYFPNNFSKLKSYVDTEYPYS